MLEWYEPDPISTAFENVKTREAFVPHKVLRERFRLARSSSFTAWIMSKIDVKLVHR
jgi:hypothetical protein